MRKKRINLNTTMYTFMCIRFTFDCFSFCLNDNDRNFNKNIIRNSQNTNTPKNKKEAVQSMSICYNMTLIKKNIELFVECMHDGIRSIKINNGLSSDSIFYFCDRIQYTTLLLSLTKLYKFDYHILKLHTIKGFLWQTQCQWLHWFSFVIFIVTEHFVWYFKMIK